MDEVPVAQVGHYAAEDADVPLRLHAAARSSGSPTTASTELNDDVEVPLIDVLADLEYVGVRVDVDAARRAQRASTAARLQKLESEIEELAGHPLNIDSPKQLAELLFQRAEAAGAQEDQDRPQHRRRRARRTRRAAPAAGEDRRVPPVREAARHVRRRAAGAGPSRRPAASTRRSTRSSPPPAGSAPATRTCKTSRSAPSEGREIRSAFVAGEPGWLLLAADYSQIELRILAHYSGDADALRSLRPRRRHPHARRQPGLRRRPWTRSPAEMRRNAKAVNFGIIYGQSPFGLAKVARHLAGGSRRVHRRLFRHATPASPSSSPTRSPQCRRQGYVTHDARPPPRDPGRPLPDAADCVDGKILAAAASSTCPSEPPSTPSSKARPPT